MQNNTVLGVLSPTETRTHVSTCAPFAYTLLFLSYPEQVCLHFNKTLKRDSVYLCNLIVVNKQ